MTDWLIYLAWKINFTQVQMQQVRYTYWNETIKKVNMCIFIYKAHRKTSRNMYKFHEIFAEFSWNLQLTFHQEQISRKFASLLTADVLTAYYAEAERLFSASPKRHQNAQISPFNFTPSHSNSSLGTPPLFACDQKFTLLHCCTSLAYLHAFSYVRPSLGHRYFLSLFF